MSLTAEDLIEFGEVPTLDTMKEWFQVIKVSRHNNSHIISIILDRKHKSNPKLSKPLGYVNVSGAQSAMLAKLLIKVVKDLVGLESDEAVLALGG